LEDKEGDADMPVAYLSNMEQITLLQLDGKLSSSQFSECLNKAIDGCKLVYEIQKEALMKKYFGNETELKEEV
jgi:exosome complex component RRP41